MKLDLGKTKPISFIILFSSLIFHAKGFPLDADRDELKVMDIRIEINFGDWNLCPPELLLTIFRYLDAKSIIACLFVNKKWKYVAEMVGQKIGWEIIAERGLQSGGIDIKMNSRLSWRDVILNSCLWSQIEYANVTKMYEYTSECRDVFVPTGDYLQENEQYVDVTNDAENNTVLKLYCKERDREQHVEVSMSAYLLRNKVCYAVKRNGGVWQYTWNESDWESSMLSRYYGSARDICALYERHSRLCAITKSGVIWAINKPRLQFKKLFYLSIPQQMPIDLELGFLSFACSVVLDEFEKYSESSKVDRFDQIADFIDSDAAKSLRIALEDFCKELISTAHLSCATFYNDRLLLGYSNGKVAVYVPEYDDTCLNTLVRRDICDIQDFSSSQDQDNKITSIKVYETKASHQLLVSTASAVYEVKLTYPQHIVDQYTHSPPSEY